MDNSRSWHWARLVLGVFAVGLGILAFSWPEATLRVVGFLFGLNLLLMGVTRMLLLLFYAPNHPVTYRVLGILLSLLVAIVGLLCLRNIVASLALMLVLVAIGWMLDGLAEIFVSLGSGREGGGWRIGLGIVAVLAGIAILVWPNIGLSAFLFIGATSVIFVGLLLVISAISGLRTARTVTA
ncbi:uncharacterized membrane protein HdeD (DUF308 family) [Actinoplanes lutulentus]|uniref:Uncharacterized membrane protein HdeD (DUF308 family) n=1 Tax=Actinoplanes lutulentus TaxID=1287878 RepID=A0A327ZDF5_9ACTN|nr:DUF308 domain-containing protein [Actinoplanes lutulentus]MBB2941274.1 uncharacterized membrane protein HdeD (DUF308 family) [Actinoplanes lutulentus]RAK36766.1 uncharacterized membrane protein HdeD (DUF308 family) [Actinoplanes lutulentus]